MDRTLISKIERPTWAEIDLPALAANCQMVQKIVGTDIRIMAVIKANAYGHGAVEIARQLENLNFSYLAVAILEEAMELRNAGIQLPILLLNGFWPGQEEELIRQDLATTVVCADMVKTLNDMGERLQKKACYHFKIDTGMTRLGVDRDQALSAIESCLQHPWAECEGILTHLSSADDLKSPMTPLQIEEFGAIVQTLKGRGVALKWTHAANSAAILGWPEAYYDGVRPGLILYGISPFNGDSLALQPLLSLKTRIMHLRRIKKGTSVGYGCTYVAPRDSVVAVLPIGYADGYNRLLSNRGAGLLHGQRVPVIGRISMDLTIIDVTAVPSAQLGDEVVLVGKQGAEEIRIHEMAELCQTIPYEILTRISPRVPRTYLRA
jgi:alanine racemase